MDLIDTFLIRYRDECDFYREAARLAAQTIERGLDAAGVRAIVTHRAKTVPRLEAKCRKRAAKRPYVSVEAIYDDIVDLAGVRVALYFPANAVQVDAIVAKNFEPVEPKRRFPDLTKHRPGNVFAGYKADHHRVRLTEATLGDLNRKYGEARLEIQVASVLMHAWAEVEHDLVYKPTGGSLSDSEYQILDQINGLVLTGELALEQLQKAGEARIASSGRKFANHYELAVHLFNRAEKTFAGPVDDSGLGRVDQLLELLRRLDLDTPERLEPFLRTLHEDVERRPLAEQVVDALIVEDPQRYQLQMAIHDAQPSAANAGQDVDTFERAVGGFIASWVQFEAELRAVVSGDGTDPAPPAGTFTQHLRKGYAAFPQMRAEIDELRRLRNDLVHGVRSPSTAELTEATRRLNAVLGELRHRRD